MFSFLGAPITFLAKVIFPLPVSIVVSAVSVTLFELKKSIAPLAVVILPEIFVAPNKPLLLMPPLKLQSPVNVSALLVVNSA